MKGHDNDVLCQYNSNFLFQSLVSFEGVSCMQRMRRDFSPGPVWNMAQIRRGTRSMSVGAHWDEAVVGTTLAYEHFFSLSFLGS